MHKHLNLPFEIKAVDEAEGIIEGYASTFGNIDQGLDVVDKGAFAMTLNSSKGKVPILADHNPSKQIGWNLEAREDEKGLWVKGRLDVKHNQLARERFSLVKQAHEISARSGLSIGYTTIKEEPDPDMPRVRRLKELKLWEYSLVTFPMNTEAMVTAAKNWAEAPTIEEALDHLLVAFRQKGYSESQILSALGSRAATGGSDPDPAVQSLLQQLEKLKNQFATP